MTDVMKFTADGFEVSVHKSKRDDNRRGRLTKKGFRLGIAYFDGIRPLETGGSVMDDLLWRRASANKPPIPNKKMFELLKTELKDRFFVDLKSVVYSRKAGCRCGCSPGYVLHGEVDIEARVKCGVKSDSERYFYFSDSYFADEMNVYVATEEYARKRDEKEQRAKAAKALKFDSALAEGANL